MDSQITKKGRLLKGLDPDRRGNVRYPLNLEVRYSFVVERGPAENGSGRTMDISISGLSFTADRPLAIGQRLDLSIEWPVLLDGGVQLQLVTSGVVVRSDGAFVALRIARPEFKTRRGGLKARHAAVG